APLVYALSNGQTVEIIAAKVGGPSRDWLNPELHFVASGRARSKVRQWFNAQNHEAALAQGRQVVDKELQRLGMTALSLETLAQALGQASVEAMLACVGRGDTGSRQIESAIQTFKAPIPHENNVPVSLEAKPVAARSATGVLVLGVDKLLTVLARCCKPVAGEAITGFVSRGRGITVHRRGCPNVARMGAERWIDVEWGQQPAQSTYPVDLEVEGAGDSRLLADTLEILARERVKVLSTQSVPRGDHVRFALTAEVSGLAQVEHLLLLLRQIPAVFSARRR
ncbi:MAG: RelA/SpoT AH/RIS domain-containing protein, partial [Burkholderiales bacterium]